MNIAFSQADRLGSLETELGPNVLVLLRFGGADHVNDLFEYQVDCLSTKPARHIRAQLEASGKDLIEHADLCEDDWIKTGMKEDRLIYRHGVLTKHGIEIPLDRVNTVFFKQSLFERIVVAILLEACAELVVETRTLATQLLHGILGLFLETELTTV